MQIYIFFNIKQHKFYVLWFVAKPVLVRLVNFPTLSVVLVRKQKLKSHSYIARR